MQYRWHDATGQRTAHRKTATPLKTKRGNRVIPLAGEIIDILRRHRARQAEERLLFGHLYDDSEGDRVLCRLGGSPLTQMATRATLKRQLRAAGLPPLRVHDLRHTYATLLESLGVPISTIGYLLGHSSVQTTERYLHALHRRAPISQQLVQQREAARRLAQALGAGSDVSNVSATRANEAP
jgi:integrase